jgi:hypothetical protein
MTQSRLLEIARLRSILQRLKRTYGADITLDILQQVIESELVNRTALK